MFKSKPVSYPGLATGQKRSINSYNFSMNDEVIGILYLSLFKDVLEAEGHAFRGYSGSLDGPDSYMKRISVKQWFQVLTESLKDIPGGLGFSYGKKLNLVAADTVGQLIMSSSTLMQALHYFQRYHLLLAISLDFEPELQGNSATLRFKHLYKPELPEILQWFATEVLFSCCLHQARWLSGQKLNFQMIKLPYATPPHAALYKAEFDCDIQFDSECHEATFDSEILNYPVITANKQLQQIKSQHCSAVLKRFEKRMSVIDRINGILNQTYPDFPSVEQVADELNTSKSCLYRKLQSRQTCYQTLVNDFKKDKAIVMLKNSALTITNIADMLGFSDASSFRRAFKSWTGKQPSAYRKKSLTLVRTGQILKVEDASPAKSRR